MVFPDVVEIRMFIPGERECKLEGCETRMIHFLQSKPEGSFKGRWVLCTKMY